MARKRILSKVINLLKKKEKQEQFILTPTTITGGKETGGIITGGKTDVITSSKAIPTSSYVPIKKTSSGGSSQLLFLPQSSANKTPVFVVTSKTAPIVTPKDVRRFNQRLRDLRTRQQQRLIRPLRPVKTIRNVGKKIDLLNRAETLQRKLETKEMRAYAIEKKPLKSFGRQTAIFGLAFGTETIRGVKGIIALPKNIIKTIPKLPRLAVNLVTNRKNIIPMAKLRFKSFKDRQGYLLKTSPSTFFGKVGANIFLFKASGKGLKLVGKVSKPATSKISKYIPKKAEKVKFTGVNFQKGNKIYSFIAFKNKRFGGIASAIGKIGKNGKLVLSEVKGKAFKIKRFPRLREQPFIKKKGVSFLSTDIGGTTAKKGLRVVNLNKGAVLTQRDLLGLTGKTKFPIIKLGKGVNVNILIKNYIQKNVGVSLQSNSKRFFNIVKGKKIIKITSKPLTLRTFISQARIFNKKDLSYIFGRAKTNLREIINFKGKLTTLRLNNGVRVIKNIGGKKTPLSVTFNKNELVNLASALSVGQVGTRRILNKLSPMARKVINHNIKAGLVLIPKLNLDKLKGGFKGVSAQSLTTSLSGLETQTRRGTSQTLGIRTRQVPRHIDYFKPITGVVSTTATKSVSRNKSVPKQQEKLISVLSTPTAQREIQRLTPRQATRLKTALRQYLRFYPNMRVPLVRVIPFGFVVKSKTKVKRTPNYRNLKTGWVVYGYSQGAYRRLNKKPLSKIDALSRGAYAIDRTTAKTFKIVPVPNVKGFGRLIKREKGYFTLTKPKFREYKIQKGTRKFITYTLIEKRRYGIDTRGEMKGLSLWRYLAKLKKSGKY